MPAKVIDKRMEALRGELQAKTDQLKGQEKQLEELRHQMMRLQADFENAKKRWLKEQAQFQEMANAGVLRQLLEIVDDLERALAPEIAQGESQVGRDDKPTVPPEEDPFRKGVKIIAQRIEELLRSHGIVPMEAVGKLFDPTRHEAVAHEATDQVPESTVLAELRKGYLMNGQVLRPAVVKVAVKKGGQATFPVGEGSLEK